MQFIKFVPICKIDAAKREVYGIVTSEAVDKDGEVCDYVTTAPYYKAWSAEFEKATDGKSLGNVREMHANKAAGKVTSLEFDETEKRSSSPPKSSMTTPGRSAKRAFIPVFPRAANM